MEKKSFQNPDPITQQVMRTPRSVDLEITSRCNLRCKYCYFFDNPKVTYQELPTGEWLKFIDELGRCGVMDVCLAGGAAQAMARLMKIRPSMNPEPVRSCVACGNIKAAY